MSLTAFVAPSVGNLRGLSTAAPVALLLRLLKLDGLQARVSLVLQW